MKKCKKSPQENVNDLSKYLEYAAKFKDQPNVIDDLNFMYEGFSDPNMLISLITNPAGLTGILNFASIGLLTRIEELLEEEKKKHQMN